MITIWKENYSCYGAERIWRALNRKDITVARCTIERLMPAAGIRGVQRGRKPWTTIVDDTASRPADLVERRFTASRPNELWLADITYVSTWEGWLYVAFISDVFSRRVVGWQIADHLRTDLVLDALEMAVNLRDLACGDLTHHSDRGCQGGTQPVVATPHDGGGSWCDDSSWRTGHFGRRCARRGGRTRRDTSSGSSSVLSLSGRAPRTQRSVSGCRSPSDRDGFGTLGGCRL